jgi:carboxylesterase
MTLLRVFVALIAAYLLRRSIGARMERTARERLPLGSDGIIEGAGPIALNLAAQRGVLILHGFADTPQTVRYLAEHLQGLGFAVHAPLLPGHGRTLPDFAASAADAWIAGAQTEFETLRRRYPSLGIVGVSMGGALATILAAATPAPDAMVLIAPYLSMRPRDRRLAELHWALSPFVRYLTSREDASIRDEAERASNRGYGVVTPRLLNELLQIVRRARAALPHVTASTLVIQSRDDNRIDPNAAEEAFHRLAAPVKRFIWTEGSGHLITVDTGREHVLSLTGAWLLDHMQPKRSTGARGAAQS